jgi:hypothetical protein
LKKKAVIGSNSLLSEIKGCILGKKSISQQPRDKEQVKLPTKNSAFCDG